MGYHSLLSPSSAHRWLECPGSIELLLMNKIDSTSSNTYAVKGNLIHGYAAYLLSSNNILSAYENLINECKNNTERIGVEEAKNYVDYVNSFKHENDILQIERMVPLYDIYSNMTGTVDSYIINKERSELHVFDLKTGFIKVKAENNPQLLLYAYGVLCAHDDIDIDLIYLHIVQDNHKVYNTNNFAINKKDLLEFISKVKSIANDISMNIFSYKEGDYCKYCPVSQYCHKVQQNMMNISNEIAKNDDTGDSNDISKISEIVYIYSKYEPIIEKYKQIIKDYLMQGGVDNKYELQYRKSRNSNYSISDDKLFLNLYNEYDIIKTYIENEGIDAIATIKMASPVKLIKELKKYDNADVNQINRIIQDINDCVLDDDEIEKTPFLCKKRILDS